MILVFIRRQNDVDHLTPVVWALARRGVPVTVLCANPLFDIQRDYRLRWLSTLPGVEVGSAYTRLQATATHRFLARLVAPAGRPAAGWSRVLVRRGWPVIRRRFYGEGWARALLGLIAPRTVVFDWVKPYQYVTGPVLQAAGALGIPTIALPHGVTITRGDLRTSGALRAGKLPDYGRMFPFDWVVVPHQDQAAYFARGGMPRERMAVLGSARFCDEWVRQGLAILPPARGLPEDGDGALKVVFMDMKSATSRRQRVATALSRLASLPFVRLVIKPHTRLESVDFPVTAGMRLAWDVPSVRLIAWADVVIGTVSSILVEALCQEKPLVYPAYLCGIGSRLEELEACWRVRDDGELVDALGALHRSRASYPVRPENVDRFLDEVVYAGSADRDVLARYCQVILGTGAARARAATLPDPVVVSTVGGGVRRVSLERGASPGPEAS